MVSKKSYARGIFLSSLGLWAMHLHAQDSDKTEVTDTVELQRVEVTGSRIKQVNVEEAQSVISIDREMIERAGVTNLSDLLRKLPQNGAGSYSETFTNSFAPGAAGVSLRGLGQNRTLVLVNGRRFPNYGFSQNITVAFVDLNSIPLAAVERVEVLKDGASAIYGADAVAGVVNIILRSDYSGAEFSGRYGGADGLFDRSFSLASGSVNEKSSLMFVVDYFYRSSLMSKERSYSRSADQRPRGGFDIRSSYGNPGSFFLDSDADGSFDTQVVDPACPPQSIRSTGSGQTCAFNFNPYSTLIPETERMGGVISWKREITPSVHAFADVVARHVETSQQMAPTPITYRPLVPSDHPANPFGQDAALAYRTTEAGARRSEIETDLLRTVFGFSGFINTGLGWDWEVAYLFGRSHTTDKGVGGYIFQDQFSDALISAAFNPFGGATNDAGVLNGFSARTSREAESEIYGGDGVISGSLFNLPTGPVGLALGGEYRKETLEDRPDSLSEQNLIVGSGGSRSSGSRDMLAGYAEVSVPVHSTLELQLAVRAEDYSDFGDTASPKVGLRFQPIPSVMLRATYSESFRAPSLSEAYLGQSLAYDTLRDGARCDVTGADEDCGATQYDIVSGGNPDIQPEESEAFTIGLFWQPLDDLTLAFDYWNYAITDSITSDSQGILDEFGTDPNFVKRYAPSFEDVKLGIPGQIDTVYDFYFNSGGEKTQGIDLSGSYRLPLESWGQWRVQVNLTRVLEYEMQVQDGDPYEDMLGKRTPLGGSRPEWKGSAALMWDKGVWGASLIARYVDEFDDVEYVSRSVASFTTFDAQVQYRLGRTNTVFNIGVDNMFDKDPPFSADQDFDQGYDWSVHDATGRLWYIGLQQSF